MKGRQLSLGLRKTEYEEKEEKKSHLKSIMMLIMPVFVGVILFKGGDYLFALFHLTVKDDEILIGLKVTSFFCSIFLLAHISGLDEKEEAPKLKSK